MAIQLIPLALAALGTFQAVNTYNNQREQADAMQKQADIDAQAAAAQIERDSFAETQKVMSLRDKNRRLRSTMEAQYATSGVLLDGSAGEVLVKQREVDEINAQNEHVAGNDRRRLSNWRADEQYKQSMYQAKSLKKGATVGLITDLATTAFYGMGTNAFGSLGGATMSATPKATMAGQTLNMNYFKSIT